MGTWIELASTDEQSFSAWHERALGVRRGGLVLVQEIFGVNPHIRAVAGRWAAAGYEVLAPAVFDRVERGVELGYDGDGVARGRELVAALGFDNALRDVAACARQLGAAGPVAVLGFCWGGTVALLATSRLGLPAVSYYGGRSMPFLHEHPQAPLLLHFGERDPIIPPDHVAKIRAAFPAAEAHVYPVGHGFNCDQRADFDAEASALAFERSLAFLDRVLRSTTR
jgi:carboxymethylenebutenolidase